MASCRYKLCVISCRYPDSATLCSDSAPDNVSDIGGYQNNTKKRRYFLADTPDAQGKRHPGIKAQYELRPACCESGGDRDMHAVAAAMHGRHCGGAVTVLRL